MWLWILLALLIAVVLLIYSPGSETGNEHLCSESEKETIKTNNNDIQGNVIHNVYRTCDDSREVVNTTLIMKDNQLTFKAPSMIEDMLLSTQLYSTEIASSDTIRIFDQTNRYMNYIYSDNPEKLKAIEAHFKKVSANNRNTMLSFKETIDSHNKQLTNNDELVRLARSFITKTNEKIFNDFNDYIVFERYLLFYCPMGLFSLDISEAKQYTCESIIEGFEDVVNIDTISNFMKGDFKTFTLIYNRFLQSEVAERELLIFSWDYLRKIAAPLLKDKFISEFGLPLDKGDSIQSIFKKSLDNHLINFNDMKTLCLFSYYAIDSGLLDNNNFINAIMYVRNKYEEIRKAKELNDYEEMLLANNEELTDVVTIHDIDLMTGYNFEKFVGRLFKEMGYIIEVTKSSGDQGIDVIATKYSYTIGIQTKLYSKPVSNSAIQEVVAGLKYYNLSKGYVVTNNYFTESAKKLAASNDVVLWNRDDLIEKITMLKFEA